MKVLIVPDFFFLEYASGAIAAKSAARLFNDLNCTVGVFTPDLESDVGFPVCYYHRKEFSCKENYLEFEVKKEFESVIKTFQPDFIFSIGAVVNRPLVYFEVIEKLKIKHSYLILCQDFYCARIHAALESGPCTKCLTGNPLNAFTNHCGFKTSNNPTLFLANGMVTRWRLKKHLQKVDIVLGSTDEQLGFYHAYGIPSSNTLKIPLFFDDSRVANEPISKGDYYVVAAQNRVEKGIHLFKHLLPYLTHTKIKLVFSTKAEADAVIAQHELAPFMREGAVEILYDISWNNGLASLYAQSKGVLITSLWPTTTEFAFLEALGLSKPVICFDLGIHHEEIINGVNGFKVALGDFEGFQKAITLLDDDEVYTQVSQGSKELYLKLTSKTGFINILSSFIK
jgi:glycosyltransferase involved in cell wall biosynthesis